MFFPPDFDWTKFKTAVSFIGKDYYIYLYKIGYGRDWEPLFIISAQDEQEAFKAARKCFIMREDEILEAHEKPLSEDHAFIDLRKK